MRRSFFAANPQASEDDFARLEQRLVDDELLRRTQAGRTADSEALARARQAM
jgi:hypothetical protein